jgi:hypothetical protein
MQMCGWLGVSKSGYYQRKKTIVKRSGKISVAGAVMVVSWGFCYGWRRVDGVARERGSGEVSGGMAEFRGGIMVVVPRGRGCPATRVFSLYVVQAGSACPP